MIKIIPMEFPESIDDVFFEQKLQEKDITFLKEFREGFFLYRIFVAPEKEEYLQKIAFDSMCRDKIVILDYHVPLNFCLNMKAYLSKKKIPYELSFIDNEAVFYFKIRFSKIAEIDKYLNKCLIQKQR